jgi:hypothetical protein
LLNSSQPSLPRASHASSVKVKKVVLWELYSAISIFLINTELHYSDNLMDPTAKQFHFDKFKLGWLHEVHPNIYI